MYKNVSAVERSQDRKLTTDHKARPVSVTLAPQYTCPTTCGFYNNGCYAERGPLGIQTHRLNNSENNGPINSAESEANAIKNLSGKYPLRIHVVGDSTTNEGTCLLADAADVYNGKYDQPVWTYTHAWRTVDRESWGDISVLASCETEQDVIDANNRGYATALVADHKTVSKKVGNTNAILCPQQTGLKKDCEECRICMKDKRLLGRATVIFSPHGATKKIGRMLAAKNSI